MSIEKFLKTNDAAEFCREVERFVRLNNGINYIDAVLEIKTKFKLDEETVAKLLSSEIKAKLHKDAEELSLFKKVGKSDDRPEKIL